MRQGQGSRLQRCGHPWQEGCVFHRHCCPHPESHFQEASLQAHGKGSSIPLPVLGPVPSDLDMLGIPGARAPLEDRTARCLSPHSPLDFAADGLPACPETAWEGGRGWGDKHRGPPYHLPTLLLPTLGPLTLLAPCRPSLKPHWKGAHPPALWGVLPKYASSRVRTHAASDYPRPSGERPKPPPGSQSPPPATTVDGDPPITRERAPDAPKRS